MADKKILGVFEGECADSNITNKNGLDITRPVWENVFNSEEYKTAIELGHLIGFLGHPEDPGCQDFEHACIVMTEGSIDDEGKVHGKFNLVDTPVGRIVKSFIDAGVTFGISVRGAGDILDNSVDPDTFVFRGFDLVTFPAYPDAIPVFTEIAASSDVEQQKKYKAVCAAVKNNIEGLSTSSSIEILQSQFAKQSDEYKALEERKQEIENNKSIDEVEEDELYGSSDLDSQRVEGLTNLYLEKVAENVELKKKNAILSALVKDQEVKLGKRTKRIESIMNSQMVQALEQLDEVKASNEVLRASNKKIKASLASAKSSIHALQKENKSVIEANNRLESDNLKYKQRVEATANDISSKDLTISDLRSELDETVTAASDAESRLSNLDNTVKKLKKEVLAANALIREYQDAYAQMYANALGVSLENVSVTSSTTVRELQSVIGSTSVFNSYTDMDSVSLTSTDIEYDADDSNLVTL